jgi:hypothetical protein
MSLEKWMKPQEEKEEIKKKPKEKKKESKSEKSQSEISEKRETVVKGNEIPEKKLSKYLLVCQKKSCGYQKTIMKRHLNDRDKTCPRCKGIMKIKKT